MTENEKLRALLAEAREEIEVWGVGPRNPIGTRIDAALAEPVAADYDIDADLRLHKEDRLRLRVENLRLERERDEARAMLSALCSEFEGAVAHADWRASGSPGMSVPFTGDFASATQLPSVVSRMRWWAREMRLVIGEEKP